MAYLCMLLKLRCIFESLSLRKVIRKPKSKLLLRTTISRRTYLSAIIKPSCWLGNMLFVKNFAVDHCLSKITWVLLKDSLSIYPKVTKIFCLHRCVACEVRVNLNYSTELHFTISIGWKATRDIVNQIAHVLKSRGSLGNNKHGG